ncbi:MAG: DEAD/DEAH box helicase [Aquificae bacterium]|nr:DEAD/DEAH box helicase [Aquificota bacterium]
MFSLLREEIRKSLEEIGFENPTPVQSRTIPVALEGRDCLVQARTGTGKTGAFALPILNNLKEGEKALVLAPTRELALQIRDSFRAFGKYLPYQVMAFYGGTKVFRDLEVLRRGTPDVVVGTPGRIRDLIERKALDLGGVRYFVLDEVDLMLSMNFKEDIDFIYSHLPQQKQVFFVSATFPPEVVELSERYTGNAFFVRVETEELKPKIEERTIKVYSLREKKELLEELLRKLEGKKVLIFVNRKKDARFLENYLRERGYNTASLHGDLPQRRREHILKLFRRGVLNFLIATDVASRGLDIEEVEAVVNYHLPEDPKVYLHRIGRTGRMGRKGTAINLVSPEERRNLDRIKRHRSR